MVLLIRISSGVPNHLKAGLKYKVEGILAKAPVKKIKKKAIEAEAKKMETVDSPLVGMLVRVIDERLKEQKFGKVGKVVSYLMASEELKIDIQPKDKVCLAKFMLFY